MFILQIISMISTVHLQHLPHHHKNTDNYSNHIMNDEHSYAYGSDLVDEADMTKVAILTIQDRRKFWRLRKI